MKRLLLGGLLLLGCGDRVDYSPICREGLVGSVAAPIVGGYPSPDRRATVKVISGSRYCSGTVVGPQTVLTAGHCKDPQVVRVEEFGDYSVVHDLAHPEYNGNVGHDLRLVYVDRQLPYPFAEIAKPGLECERLTVQGYGIGSEGALHERFVETVLRYDDVIITTEASCNGDSGGPLWALRADGSYVQVGVTSFGAGAEGTCDGPGGYANLLVLGDWVREHI